MRSIFVFLRDTTETEVTTYLDSMYPAQREPWVMLVDGDPRLYIDLYRDGQREHEPQEWADIVQRFGGEPAVAVITDVSGRHPGDEPVAAFVATLLSRFHGAAMDEYTTHLWTPADLSDGLRVAGHMFFDYKGWIAESQ